MVIRPVGASLLLSLEGVLTALLAWFAWAVDNNLTPIRTGMRNYLTRTRIIRTFITGTGVEKARGRSCGQRPYRKEGGRPIPQQNCPNVDAVRHGGSHHRGLHANEHQRRCQIAAGSRSLVLAFTKEESRVLATCYPEQRLSLTQHLARQ